MLSLIINTALPPTPLLPSWISAGLSLVGLFALVWNVYVYLRKETAESKAKRQKSQSDIVDALKARNDAADTERQTLMAESEQNKKQHGGFQRANLAMSETIQLLIDRQGKAEVAAAGRDARDQATRETMDRIHEQLSLLIANFLSRH